MSNIEQVINIYCFSSILWGRVKKLWNVIEGDEIKKIVLTELDTVVVLFFLLSAKVLNTVLQ